MKTLAFSTQNNMVDLRTVEPNDDNKCYLVDKRLLDVLLEQVTAGSLEDIKKAIVHQVDISENKEDLFARVDRYIYLDKIVQLVNPVVEKNVGKIDLTKFECHGIDEII